MNELLEWQFGGWLRDLPASVSWTLLVVFGFTGFVLIVWLYRRTLRELSPRARWSLALLRIGMLIALLLCLANPSRVASSRRDEPARRTLAVLVDRSDSMSGADQRGETRLRNALRIWNRHADEAGRAFEKLDFFRFSTTLDGERDLEAAAKTEAPGPETHLYSALQEALARRPGAIVCLTDGLDTTGAEAHQLVATAQREGVPLYFVAGQNRARMAELAEILEIKTPSRALRQTQFSASALLQIATARPREVPVSLWSRGEKLAEMRVQARAGVNMLPWAVTVSAKEPGPMPLEFRLGENSAQQFASSTTQVVEKTSIDVLYYQGALQWGYRFLLGALQTDPSFRVAGILNPALRVQLTSAAGKSPLEDIPESATALKRFQIVILADVCADQLSSRQQQALIDYAKGGGGVLFIISDTQATMRFAGTPLEQMLPIVFEPAAPEKPEDLATRRFQEQLASMGGANSASDTMFAERTLRKQEVPEMEPFSVAASAPKTAAAAQFEPGKSEALPRFSDFAKVRRSKPGADILSVHPTARSGEENAPRILLARQQFGDGFTAALTTDLLWRWKMSLPSTSRAAEKFWQQLLLSLAPPAGTGLRIVKGARTAVLDQPCSLQIEGASAGEPPTLIATPPRGAPREIAVRPATLENGDGWQASFNPEMPGQWEIRATDAAHNEARVSLRAGAKSQTTETMNLPPDIEGLRRIAESTGGAMIEDEPVFRLRTEEPVEIRRARPLWNSNWLLGLLLGLYGTELIARRFCRLL
jgi:hypothetical protein